MRGRSRLACAAWIAAVVASSGHAWADPTEAEAFPNPSRPFRVELMGGGTFGTTTLPTGESINAYGATAAIRAAYVLRFGGYAGVRYDHFFGSTSSYPVPLVAMVEHRTGASFVGPELGVELAIAHALFRPNVALGALGLRRSMSCTPVDGSFAETAQQLCDRSDAHDTQWAFAAVPGLLMGLGWSSFYGFVDTRYYVRDEAGAFGILGGVGLTL
jgi:hypothetical protein